MKDKDGYEIRCIHSDWKIIDKRDNKDYVCTKYSCYRTGWHICHCDDLCKDYKPITNESEGNNDE